MPHRITRKNIGASIPAVNDPLLSVKEAAAFLGVSASWVSQSNIPKVKFNRRTLYRPSDLRAYVNAHVSHDIGGER